MGGRVSCGFKVLVLSVRFVSSTVSLQAGEDDRFSRLLFSSWQAVPLSVLVFFHQRHKDTAEDVLVGFQLRMT